MQQLSDAALGAGRISFKGPPPDPRLQTKQRKDDAMDKQKTDCRMAFRATTPEKERIERIAKECGLTTSEYLRQRALGFEPRAVPPDALFAFCEKLDAFTEPPFSQEVNKCALMVLTEIDKWLVAPGKEAMSEWQPQASGQSKCG